MTPDLLPLRPFTALLAALVAVASPVLAGEAVPSHHVLTRPVVQPDERFAGAIAMSGTTALVGVASRDFATGGPVPDAGAVEVYAGDAAGWTHQQTLTAPIAESGRMFGIGLALSGPRVAIASLYRLDLFERATPAHAYGHSGSLVFPPLGGIRHAAAIALDGDRLAYGFGSSAGAGRVHVYRRSAGVWQQQAVLFAVEPTGNDGFGSALAFNGDQLLVGAPGEDLPGTAAAGAVYVYQVGVAAPVFVQRIDSFVVRDQAGFGQRLVTEGGRLLVGAPGEQLVANGNAGAAYLYQRAPGGDWQFEQRFVAPDFQADAYFGSALALSGASLAIGAPGQDVVFGQFPFLRAGRAYVYRQGPGTWTLIDLLALPFADIDNDDRFAEALALGQDWLLVGAGDDEAAGVADAGQAWVYVLPIFRNGFEL